MKHFSYISIAFTTLILLVFGSGGVGIEKCACSGKISIANPLSEDCCPNESGCMMVTVVQLSSGEMQHCTDVPMPYPFLTAIFCVAPQPVLERFSEPVSRILFDTRPPGYVDKIVLMC
ncbi:MAG: hypothetical protein J5848_01185 [Bacteroidales bacterium]|nr:hypothetical protein [Bacteroidales bacterium]